MSDPYDTAPDGTRFLMCGYDAHPKEFASGDWVRYSDYARLKAEVERLRKSTTLTAVPCEVYEELKAELELIYKLDPLLREAIASAVLASKGGRP
jgi:hypothetical protein